MSTKKLFILFTFIASSVFATKSIAQEDEDPKEMLASTIASVIDTLHAGSEMSIEDKRSTVLAELEKTFSFDIIIRRTLGRNWDRFTEDQQEKITILITDLLIKAYTTELSGAAKPEINVLKSEDLGANKLEIYTTVSYRNNLVSVNYRLANIKNRGWQVYDILIEGTSIVSNYRGQFDEHFQTKSAEDLLEVIANKIENYEKR